MCVSLLPHWRQRHLLIIQHSKIIILLCKLCSIEAFFVDTIELRTFALLACSSSRCNPPGGLLWQQVASSDWVPLHLCALRVGGDELCVRKTSEQRRRVRSASSVRYTRLQPANTRKQTARLLSGAAREDTAARCCFDEKAVNS